MKMSANVNLIIHPQAEAYRQQNRQLQTSSIELMVERDHLQCSILPHIFAEYQLKIGALELSIFQFDCEIRAFIRRIEMAQAALNRGEKPCYKNIEAEIKTEFAAWREKIEQQTREIKAAKERETLPTLSSEESRELQAIYRRLAFQLHPDITGNTNERRQKFWLQTVEAYKNGDLQILQTILLLVGNEPTENHSADECLNILESLKNRNDQLKQICEKLLDEISEIKTSAPFIWHKILDDPIGLEKHQNDLREKIEIMRGKRRQLIEHWTEILRFAGDCENVEIPEEPADLFAEDNWSEIIYEF